jgi:hypothetical protein
VEREQPGQVGEGQEAEHAQRGHLHHLAQVAPAAHRLEHGDGPQQEVEDDEQRAGRTHEPVAEEGGLVLLGQPRHPVVAGVVGADALEGPALHRVGPVDVEQVEDGGGDVDQRDEAGPPGRG